MAIGEWEIWACAQQLVKQHGPAACAKAQERASELDTAGEAEGARTFRLIADRIAQLQDRGRDRSLPPH